MYNWIRGSHSLKLLTLPQNPGGRKTNLSMFFYATDAARVCLILRLIVGGGDKRHLGPGLPWRGGQSGPHAGLRLETVAPFWGAWSSWWRKVPR